MAGTDGKILARWQTQLIGVSCTPLAFFEEVEDAVRECEFPDTSFSQITRREGGSFSARRVYLRIRFDRLFFDVSAFVSGGSLVVGYWLHEDLPGISDLFSEIPGIGFLLEQTMNSATYYRVDYFEHFQRAVHDSILHVVDELSERNGTALLSEAARQPIWDEIW